MCPNLFATLPNVCFSILILPFLSNIADVISEVEIQYIRAKTITYKVVLKRYENYLINWSY
jgi:hypothetical protein